MTCLIKLTIAVIYCFHCPFFRQFVILASIMSHSYKSKQYTSPTVRVTRQRLSLTKKFAKIGLIIICTHCETRMQSWAIDSQQRLFRCSHREIFLSVKLAKIFGQWKSGCTSRACPPAIQIKLPNPSSISCVSKRQTY